MMKTTIQSYLCMGWVLYTAVFSSGCSESNSSSVSMNPMENKGIGPVESLALDKINTSLADKGKEVFTAKCSACHKIDVKFVGPALNGVTNRRSPEWIMNMILNPTEMTQKDPIAKELLATFMAPMANQNLTMDEARSVLEYFRQNDSK